MDRYSRKKILLAENIVGFLVLFLLTIWGYFGEYTNGSLIVIYLVTTLIFQVHYPAQTALVQEQFESKSYHAINSLLEIESQTSSVLAGGVAGFLLGLIGLQYVLFFNALTYLFAFLMVCRISYSFTFFTLVGLFMRLILIGLFTVITDTTGAVLGHIILIGLLLLGVLGIMRSLRPLLQESVERST
ncbi:MFS transporter [Brevibacillus sp. VP]|uniref:MFS transporter n=1 Tax=unclassified Brevibacillus TaxID=2684853 RepID=UPI00228738C6|nr:MFS transporter [Brevibacillus sp. VP]